MSKKTLLFLSCFILIAFAAETSLQPTNDASVRCPTAPVMNKMVNMELESAETDAAIWNTDVQITTNGLYNYTYYSNMRNVVAEASGRVHVVWMDGTSPYNVHYMRYTPGFGWSNDTMFANSGQTYQRYTAIALDSSGTIHVVYGAGTSSSANYRIYYKSCTPVGTGNDGWGADTLLSNTLTTNYKYYPNVACSPNGNVHVVWREYNSSSPYYYRVAYLEKIAGTWQTQVNLDSSSTSLYDYKYYPCVAAGRDNNIHITWYGYWNHTSPYAIIYKARLSGVWQAAELVRYVSGMSQYNPTIAVNNLTNEPHITWRGYPSPYYMVHSRRTSGAWTVPDTITPYGGTTNYSYMPQISCGPGGKMHVVFYGYHPSAPGIYNISYSERSASGSWSYPVIITNGVSATYRYYPSITVNDSDYIHVVWYDNRSGSYEIWYVKGNPPLAYDVGVDQVYSPPAAMGRNTSYSPAGRVQNYGANAASSVPVYCQIDSAGTQIYTSNVTITGPIAPGDTAGTGLFTSWTSGDYGTGYLLRMFTNWGSDLNNANDTMSMPLYIPALQWSQIPDLPAARYRCAGTGDTFGNFWVAGGWANSSVSNNLYKFDGSSWTTMANMPGVNSNFDAVWNPADNCIYTVGGYDGSTAYNAFWCYDVAGDSWYALANVPLSGYGYTQAIVGDSLYALYGLNLMIYSFSNGNWSFGPSKPLGGTSGHGGMCALNGVVYHAGGWTADAYFYSYTPGTGWTRLPDLPIGRQGLGLCAMDGKIYMVGGGSSWSLVPQPWVYVYNPSDPGLGWAVENNCLGTGTYAGAYGVTTWPNGVKRIYACGGLDVSSNRMTYSQKAGFPLAIDVGVDQILAPSGLLGSGTHTPQARIKNYGLNAVGSFTVRLDINPGGYSNTQTVTSLSSGDSIDVTFADWTVSSGGFYSVSCTTALATDQDPSNDMMTDAFGVYNYNEDFENAGVYTPNPASGAWEWGDPVSGPGSSPDDTLCWGTNINGLYNASSNWMLNSINYFAGQDNPILAYWHWYENESYWDGYNVKYSTDGGSSWTLIHALPGYGQPYDQITSSANAGIPSESAYSYLDRTWRLNFMTVPVSFGDSFRLRWHFGSDGSVQYWGTAIDFVCGIGFDTVIPIDRDVAIMAINAPTGNVDTINPKVPRATVYNYGEQAETFDVTMDITGPVSFFYTSTKTVSALPPLNSLAVDFDSVKLNELGTHNVAVYVSTPVPGDSNPSNDSMFGTFEGVEFVPPEPWQPMADVPAAPSGKNPKSGSCLQGLEATDLIYFLKASNRPDFYSYDPATNVWTALETIPKGEKGADYADGKYPKRGAAMAAYEPGKCLYVVRGNNRLGFWKYQADTLDDSIMPGIWSPQATIPAGAKRCKYGTGLVHVTKGGEDKLFLLKGAKTSETYMYDIATNAWSPLASVPPGASGKIGYKKGSCVAYDGSEYVYILQGYYGTFFKYKVEADSFTELKWYDYKTYRNREGKKKKPKDGASLVYYMNNIYMLKGGNTVEVWKYDIALDDWVQMDELWDIPLGPTGRKKVKDGGGMIYFGDYFWATKGKNTPEFYRHVLPSPVAYTIPKPTNDGVMGSTVKTGAFKLTIAPNPATNLTAIKYSLPVPGPVTFKLYNITGALVKSHTITNPTKDGVLTLDAKSLPAGVYMLRFNSGEIKVTRKLVLEK